MLSLLHFYGFNYVIINFYFPSWQRDDKLICFLFLNNRNKKKKKKKKVRASPCYPHIPTGSICIPYQHLFPFLVFFFRLWNVTFSTVRFCIYNLYRTAMRFLHVWLFPSSYFFFLVLSFFFLIFFSASLDWYNSVCFFETKIHLNTIPVVSNWFIVALWAC